MVLSPRKAVKLDCVVVLIRLGSLVMLIIIQIAVWELPALNVWQPTRWVGHTGLLWRPGVVDGLFVAVFNMSEQGAAEAFLEGGCCSSPNGRLAARVLVWPELWGCGMGGSHISHGGVEKEGREGAEGCLQVHYLNSWIRSITGDGDKGESSLSPQVIHCVWPCSLGNCWSMCLWTDVYPPKAGIQSGWGSKVF